uniref:REJ domain-containing protein n=1 Tax=Oryza meridionalis TaxID=40149 RepID=A0A0E0FEL3_9ORYZ
MPASFEALSWARDPCASPSSLLFSSSSSPGRHYYWSWKNVADTPPPFGEEEAVTAYAVHPDGRTIFVSTGGGTYSFDTGRRHGDWVLPFRGQGYFDGELDAWVGLHREVRGRVCACQVASRGGARPPEYRETLDYDSVSSSRSKNRRQRATLTYKGDCMF